MRRLLGVLLLAAGTALSQSAPTPEKSLKLAEQILLEATLPPPGTLEKNKDQVFAAVLGKTSLTKYADEGEPQKKLRELVRKGQVILWATTPLRAPKMFAVEVTQVRKELKGTLVLEERIPIPTTPAAEKRLKEQILTTSKHLARAVAMLEEMVDELKEVDEMRGKENPRWQANYDLVLAWLQQRIVYLEEHGLALGTMRKEQPPYDAVIHKAWRLVSHERQRDTAVKKRSREAEKLLQQLVKEHPDSVWADLAQKALKVPLGVEWRAVK